MAFRLKFGLASRFEPILYGWQCHHLLEPGKAMLCQ